MNEDRRYRVWKALSAHLGWYKRFTTHISREPEIGDLVEEACMIVAEPMEAESMEAEVARLEWEVERLNYVDDECNRWQKQRHVWLDEKATLEAQLAEARGQIPHPGDGSCERCGAVPAVAAPTVLCPDCLTTEAERDTLDERVLVLEQQAQRMGEHLLWCPRCEDWLDYVEAEETNGPNLVHSECRAVVQTAFEHLNAPTPEEPEPADDAKPEEESAEVLARRFHEVYERLASGYGYETRKASAVPWEEVPENNRALMIATCREVFSTPESEDEIVGCEQCSIQHAPEQTECERCGGTLTRDSTPESEPGGYASSIARRLGLDSATERESTTTNRCGPCRGGQHEKCAGSGRCPCCAAPESEPGEGAERVGTWMDGRQSEKWHSEYGNDSRGWLCRCPHGFDGEWYGHNHGKERCPGCGATRPPEQGEP